MKQKIHRTSHAASGDENGDVYCYCICGWRTAVHVEGLSFMEGIAAIFKARDEHEAEQSLAQAEGGETK